MRSALLAALLLLAVPQALGLHANDRLIAEALTGLGVDPASPAIQRAVPEAFAELLPEARYTRYRLNRTQARAVAYIAVLFAADGRRASPATPAVPPPVRLCTGAVEAVYDLSAAVPARSSSLFLTNDEKEAVRDGAAGIRRGATACGCLALAETALALDGLTRPLNASREDVVETLAEMRRLAADCD